MGSAPWKRGGRLRRTGRLRRSLRGGLAVSQRWQVEESAVVRSDQVLIELQAKLCQSSTCEEPPRRRARQDREAFEAARSPGARELRPSLPRGGGRSRGTQPAPGAACRRRWHSSSLATPSRRSSCPNRRTSSCCTSLPGVAPSTGDGSFGASERRGFGAGSPTERGGA